MTQNQNKKTPKSPESPDFYRMRDVESISMKINWLGEVVKTRPAKLGGFKLVEKNKVGIGG